MERLIRHPSTQPSIQLIKSLGEALSTFIRVSRDPKGEQQQVWVAKYLRAVIILEKSQHYTKKYALPTLLPTNKEHGSLGGKNPKSINQGKESHSIQGDPQWREFGVID